MQITFESDIKPYLLAAIQDQNLTETQKLVGLWVQLEDFARKLPANSKPAQTDVPPRGGDSIRAVLIEVMQGAIEQRYLSVTKAVQKGFFDKRDTLTISIPLTGERFLTQVSRHANFLRERKRIAEFYREAGIVEGDHVLFKEVEPNVWELTPKKVDVRALLGV